MSWLLDQNRSSYALTSSFNQRSPFVRFMHLIGSLLLTCRPSTESFSGCESLFDLVTQSAFAIRSVHAPDWLVAVNMSSLQRIRFRSRKTNQPSHSKTSALIFLTFLVHFSVHSQSANSHTICKGFEHPHWVLGFPTPPEVHWSLPFKDFGCCFFSHAMFCSLL